MQINTEITKEILDMAGEQLNMSLFFTIWPWIGLGAAIVILILAFGTDVLCGNKEISRWKDMQWLAWMGAVVYMLHNVEEHGIGFDGVVNPFAKFMYVMLGVDVGEFAMLACNLLFVWVCGPVAAYLTRKHKGFVACMTGFELINAIGHIVQAVAFKMYNPGVVSSIVIFVPLCIWILYTCFGKGEGKLSWKTFFGQMGISFLYQLILVIGILLTISGKITQTGFGWLMVSDMFVILAGWWFVAQKFDRKSGKQ